MSVLSWIAGAIAAAAAPAALFCVAEALAAELEISNQSSSEILNILAEPADKKGAPVFLRLDLAPGASGMIENPDFTADLRADTGLQLWLYKSVPLKGAAALDFCQEYPGCLAARGNDGKIIYQAAGLQELVPQPGSKPVCELGRFHPLMPMKEVCAILERDLPLDDNGACLTGLGFAGKLWAARLTPFQNGPITENSLLEHMELRRPLSQKEALELLDALYKQGYAPWQAEFPGKDMDFAASPALKGQAGRRVLEEAIDRFLGQEKKGPIKNNFKDDEAEARVLLAPAESLGALANADNPPQDIQLFTLVLKPQSSVLLLDVTAYKGEGGD